MKILQLSSLHSLGGEETKKEDEETAAEWDNKSYRRIFENINKSILGHFLAILSKLWLHS